MLGLGLIEKIFSFALNLFIRNRTEREELRKNFDQFFKKSGNDSTVSSGMHEEYEDIKKDNGWIVKKRKPKKKHDPRS